MEKRKNKEIIVTITCAIFIAITSIIAAFVAREKVTVYEYKEMPTFDFINTSDYFPLAPGNQWVYEGTVANAVVGSSDIIEKEVMLTMSVQDIVQNGDIILYIMSGHPGDAIWALETEHIDEKIVEIPPTEYGYLVVSNKIFYIEKSKLGQIIQGLRGDGYLGNDIVSQDNLAFEFPLFKGQRFGEVSQIIRQDLRYFWYVNDRINFHEPKTGLVKVVPEYQLIYNTLPDFVEINFIPYLGILSYKYSHHGTKCEVNISLSDYKIHLDK